MKKIIIALSLVFLLFSCNDDDMSKHSNNDNDDVTITFDTGIGSEVTSVTITYASKLDPVETEKDGYSFQGWFLDSGFKTQFDFGKTLKAQITYKDSITLYAKLSEKLYKVTYDGNGNTFGVVPVDNNLYAEGDTVHLIDQAAGTKPQKDGVRLGGWEIIGNFKSAIKLLNPEAYGISLEEGTGLIFAGSDEIIIISANNIVLKARYFKSF